MSNFGVVIFVEGPSDKRFIECLVRSIGLENIEVFSMNGNYRTIGKVAPRIRMLSNEGKTIALVLDADEDCVSTRAATREIVERQEIDIYGTFLIPNDEIEGDLETLLESIMVQPHQLIMDCFDEYISCIRNCPHDYELPDRKARIYAYCQAVGIETQPGKRNYNSDEHWNLEAPELTQLTAFLHSLVD